MKTTSISAGTVYVTSGAGRDVVRVLSTDRFEQTISRMSGEGSISPSEPGCWRQGDTRYGVLVVDVVRAGRGYAGREAQAALLSAFTMNNPIDGRIARDQLNQTVELEDGSSVTFRLSVKRAVQIESTLADFTADEARKALEAEVRREAARVHAESEQRDLAELRSLLGVNTSDKDTIRLRGAGMVSVSVSDLLDLVRQLAA